MTDKVGRLDLPRVSRSAVDAILKRVARPEKRSPLFWWLLDHHDELCQAQAQGGLGLQWEKMCSDFAALEITALGGKTVTPETARITWFRVRKEKRRIQELQRSESAEREARRATDPRRNMPSRFPKGEYGPPLSDVQPNRRAGQLVTAQPGARALRPANERLTPEEQRARGLQLSTVAGVVVTEISRVFKMPDAVEDFEFRENGIIRGRQGWASALQVKQEMNKRSGRPINDDTEEMYAECKLEIEKL